ncbi:unnamed protein product [Orchesella dallaii]|uniref:Membrane-associated guanylate kinase, WW and PDZ domain-containing protein 1 n=1 Tax=Orchesella dallaii TaxID=48710 RepID=A0ABP1QJE8_9HEXA
MPDSGIVSTMSQPQHPPFYSPPAPPPPPVPGSHHHGDGGGGYHHHMSNSGYNGGDNINSGMFARSLGGLMNDNGGSNGGGGGRTVSFSNNNNPNNNPNDPNNNSGSMDESNGGDMMNNSRDLFEDIRNGGGHWSRLLRQVVLTPPNLEEFMKDDPMMGMDGGNNGDNSGSGTSNTMVPLQIVGGSENGQFVYVGITNQDINRWITVGYLQPGDIILEIQGQQVAGYTQADVISLLHHCLRGNSATLTVAPRGSLGPELRSYLNTRFQKGSVDHALQGVVRDNLYLRTVPVTTRSPRPGEINGVDYTFLSVEEFMQLERDGSLLESGVYAGNHYGTPKPWARLRGGGSDMDNVDGISQSIGENSSKGPLLPGMHPSSEGKRRRNRSNVEALGAGGGDDEPPSSPNHTSGGSLGHGNPNSNTPLLTSPYANRIPPQPDALGPLPANWEMAYTEKGEVYFIDHNTGTSHWLDPRLARVQKKSLDECEDDELPFDWEKIIDPHYGIYYIDHTNRRTQFENPVIQAKANKSKTNSNDSSQNNGNGNGMSTDGSVSEADSSSKFPENNKDHHNQYLPKRPISLSKPHPPAPNPKPQNPNRLSITRGKTPVDMERNSNHHHDMMSPVSSVPSFAPHASSSMQGFPNSGSSSGGLRVKPVMDRPSFRFFTRDPSELIGERILTALLKSSRGLGFTIVGGDDDDGLDEFLQIKSVVHDGPAWRDGKLRTGDVLVRVNGMCVLGHTHQEMVGIFQSIAPGQEVHLEVCRGYPLPFDPSDPNTEIVTTVAVEPLDGAQKKHVDWAIRPSTPESLTHSAHSLPELSNDRFDYGKPNSGRPASVDLLLDSPTHPRADKGLQSKHMLSSESGAVLTVQILKGNAGFGFTIADSVTGQKVKKVLDATHCGGLEEGDRLIAIDGVDLRGLSHTEVVQILKDFPVGRDACLTIQRTPQQSPYNKFSSSGVPHNYSDNRLIPHRPSGISPRSKTPTAELARGRPRLRDNLPERPKTPSLLDSSGQYNGQPMSGLFNGDVSQLNSPLLPNSHQFLSDRLSTSSVPLTNNPNDPNFSSADLNNLPVIRDWNEMTIDLQRRQEGFGFRIVGGTEEGSQVSVGHIVPGGAAALDGRLNTGDQLIAVEGISVIGASHHSVVQLMARSASAGKVRLTVRRPIYGTTSSVPSDSVVTPIHSPGGGPGNHSTTPLHVALRRQPSEGFGFVIISSASKAGATIGRIVEGSPADRCGELHVGDRILAVNQLDISQLHHSQVVQLIKDSGLVLTLSVLPVHPTPSTPTGALNSNAGLQPVPMTSPGHMHHNSISPAEMENLSLKDSQTGDMGTAFISPEGHPIHFSSNHSAASSYPDTHEQVFSVHLNRGNRGFGFSIRGGKEFQNMPLFVLRLAEDGPAAMDGRMQVGDQILQINGINTQGMTHAQAIHLIKTGGASVHLLLRRGSVPFPFLIQMPNLSSGGFGSTNGQEEEQSLSNASNNETQFISQNASMYRDHQAGF